MPLKSCLKNLCFSLSLPLTAFAQTTTTPLNNAISQALTNACLDPAQTAVHIVNVSQNKTVYTYNATASLMPASTLKIVTTAAALHYLGPEYRFKTSILQTGTHTDGRLQGDLILRGGGDPKLASEQLWKIAQQLHKSGLREITGNLIIDTTFFDNLDRAPSWDTTRSQQAYDAALSALSIDYNTVSIHLLPNSREGDTVRAWLEPAPTYLQLNNQAFTARGESAVAVKRQETTDQVILEITGKLNRNAEEVIVRRNIPNPTYYTATTFALYLNQVGINLYGSVQNGITPNNATLLHTHESPPLSMILKELNTYSNNFIAEQILKTIAAEKLGKPGSHTEALRLIQEFLTQSRVDLNGVILADGSGLSRQNRFTAQAMTDLLAAMYPRFDIGPDFISSLRILGARGVHSQRLKSSPARGQIRAKTGTLDGVSTLVGYVPSTNNQLYAYALFSNNKNCDSYKFARQADTVEDSIVNALYTQPPQTNF